MALTKENPNMSKASPHFLSTRRAIALAGVAVAVPATALAVVAGSAGATSGPSLQVSQESGLTAGQSVTITGSGFTAGSLGTVAETNNTATSIGTPDTGPQPLTNFYVLGTLSKQVPVSTHIPFSGGLPLIVSVAKTGKIKVKFAVERGTIGDIPIFAGGTTSGIAAKDLSGGDSYTDAASYPVPPLPGQKDHNGNQAVAVLTYANRAGEQVQVPIYFGPLTVSSSSGSTLPDATRGAAYAGATLTGGNGVAPFVFKATGLPKGLVLSKAGVISGTPAAKDKTGSYDVKVSVSDTKPGKGTGSATYTLVLS